MLIMEYPSIGGEYFPDYSKKDTWILLYAYIGAHNQILIDDCTGDVVQAISRFLSQCANMTSFDQIFYNRLFQQVIHKGGESATNYIKIFHHSKALDISVGNSYFEYYLEAGTRRAGVEELTMILPPWSIERERVGSLLMWF